MEPHWEDEAHQVAQQYPELHVSLDWEPIRSGFSGAKLWRVTTDAGSFALRAWPAEQSSPARLDFIHGLMCKAAAKELRFVPGLLRTKEGRSWHVQANRAWEVSAWMPGHADFSTHPSLARLLAAVRALAKLHRTWRLPQPIMGPSTGIQRRMARLAAWPEMRERLQSAHLPDDLEGELVCRSIAVLVRVVSKAKRKLHPWSTGSFPLQPCLADLWHDHVLYHGDKVTGIIDYGSVRRDHISVDLARLLGSLAPDDQAWWAAALDAYSSRGKLLPGEWDLVRVLDYTGMVAGVMNWLEWMTLGTRTIDNRDVAIRRWTLLLNRLENMR